MGTKIFNNNKINYSVNVLLQNYPHYNFQEKELYEKIYNFFECYKNKIDIYISDFYHSKIELINLLYDCYIISFLQILFHSPNFLKILKGLNTRNETIIYYLLKVSENPYKMDYFCNLKHYYLKLIQSIPNLWQMIPKNLELI